MTICPPKLNIDETQTYRALLGELSWDRLHPAIQHRFSQEQYHQTVTYTGIMQEVYLSRFGAVLAQFCRLIGTPLALHSGANVPATVKVYPNAHLRGMTWDRYYYFSKKSSSKKTVDRVKSTKCINRDLGLIELVGFGFGMQLKLKETDAALYFESVGFFWQLGKIKISIPDVLSPGKTIVKQRALDDHRFEFSLRVTHSLLGVLFRQVGVFQRDDVADIV